MGVGPVIHFKQNAARALQDHVRAYDNSFTDKVYLPLQQHFGVLPKVVEERRQSIFELQQDLCRTDVEIEMLGQKAAVLKTALMFARRDVAAEVDSMRHKTFDADILDQLEKRVESIEIFLRGFSAIEAAPALLLTDFMPIRFVENLYSEEDQPRIPDEKFGILEAPQNFIRDLERSRLRCQWRRAPVAVVFLDIDDFKGFNTTYKEPIVDRDILPLFMSTIESVVFSHGTAYRIGGDEYEILLPNASRELAIRMLARLQIRLAHAEYRITMKTRPTVSAGLCVIDESTTQTDEEIVLLAAKAKDAAKANGKNRVVAYKSAALNTGDYETVVEGGTITTDFGSESTTDRKPRGA